MKCGLFGGLTKLALLSIVLPFRKASSKFNYASLHNWFCTIWALSNTRRNLSQRENNFLALLLLSFLLDKWSAVLLSNLMSSSTKCSTVDLGTLWSSWVYWLQCVICLHVSLLLSSVNEASEVTHTGASLFQMVWWASTWHKMQIVEESLLYRKRLVWVRGD